MLIEADELVALIDISASVDEMVSDPISLCPHFSTFAITPPSIPAATRRIRSQVCAALER